MLEIAKYPIAALAMVAALQPAPARPAPTPAPAVQRLAAIAETCPPRWPYVVKLCVA